MICALQGLSYSQKDQVSELLEKFSVVYTDKIGCTSLVQCELKVNGDPIALKPYPVSYHKRQIISEHIQKMLEKDIIEPSESEWASPIHMKLEGEAHRFTCDYRKLNQVTASDPFPIPRMDTLLNRLGEATYITKLDLRKGYWQIKMHPDSIKYTAFICHEGKYQFKRLPFGLKTAPSIFQRFINRVLGSARGRYAEAYLDDLLIFSNTWEDHMKHLTCILKQLRQAGVTLNTEKCSFGETSIKYLGFVVTPRGVETDPDKTNALRDYPVPKTCKQVKRFLGFCGWYRHFIPNFSCIAEPLNQLLKKSASFSWKKSNSIALTNCGKAS